MPGEWVGTSPALSPKSILPARPRVPGWMAQHPLSTWELRDALWAGQEREGWSWRHAGQSLGGHAGRPDAGCQTLAVILLL